MKIKFPNIFGSKPEKVTSTNIRPAEMNPDLNASIYTGSGWGPAYAVSFDGEKNLGEMGPAKEYFLNYPVLRIRAWQAYLENDVAKTILDKSAIWTIGSGLTLQSTPVKLILEKYKIQTDTQKLNKMIEAMFGVWAKSKRSSFNEQANLHNLSKQAFKAAKVGGDVLVILRYKNKNLSIELIDGECVDSDYSCDPKNGNKVCNGIEKDKTGRHIRYWISKKDGGYYKLDAYNKTTGLRQVFMVYGSKYRIDSDRGLPVIATVLETLKKLERYKEATVGSAEERQKIAYYIHHQLGAEGENPFLQQIAKAYSDNNNEGSESLPLDELGKQMANDVAASTNKQVFNMPPGATMSDLESKNELYFEEFYKTNANIICACMNIPPNVAFSMYTDSFSASRAATKDWEHTMHVERSDFQMQFYQPIYDFWLHMMVLEGNIDIPGYLSAFFEENHTLIDSFRSARFIGRNFPHIDPVKEAQAERLKLGAEGANIPLTTPEQASENLGSGDFYSNVEHFAEGLRATDDAGIKRGTETENKPTENSQDSDEDED